MSKTKIFLLLVVAVSLPVVIVFSPILLPVALIYGFAAINLRQGYGKLYCGGPRKTTRQRIIESLESKGLPIPEWVKKEPKSCYPTESNT